MYCKIQLVMYTGDGREETVTDVLTLMKDSQRIEHLGLALAEAKQLLTLIQQHLLAQQIDAFLAAHSCCEGCGALKVKGDQTRTFRTLFGTFTLSSPRLFHCRCQHRKTITFRPLTSLLTEPVAPELLLIETKWASLVSYGLTVQALTDFLPLEVTLDVKTVRHDTLKVAERCEAELGEEQWSFIEGCLGLGHLTHPRWPDHRGHRWRVRARLGGQETQLRGHCRQEHAGLHDEEEELPSSKRFGFVHTIDPKPKRRLYEVCTRKGSS